MCNTHVAVVDTICCRATGYCKIKLGEEDIRCHLTQGLRSQHSADQTLLLPPIPGHGAAKVVLEPPRPEHACSRLLSLCGFAQTYSCNARLAQIAADQDMDLHD